MNLCCADPVLLFNRKLQYLLSTVCDCAYFNGHIIRYNRPHRFYDFPWRDFYAFKKQVTPDNIDQFYLFSSETEEKYPIFIYVPCGHCALCVDRKNKDWETRCLCESATSDYAPVFVTLTYANDTRPSTPSEATIGFQKFMKRLRININRHLGIKDCELRYYFRSELTPKNHFPHWHGLIWRMPFVSPRTGEKNSFEALNRFIADAWQYGFVKVEVCRDPSGRYAMKYASKEIGDWSIQLASRRPGIGAYFAMQLLETMTRNCDLTSFTVPVRKKKNGVETVSYVKCPIPLYFKRMWFPTLSVIMPQRISNAVRDFMRQATELYYFSRIYYSGCFCSDILSMVRDVSSKYGRLYPIDFEASTPSRKFICIANKFCHDVSSVGSYHYPDTRRYVYECKPEVVDGWLVPKRKKLLVPSDIVSFPSVKMEENPSFYQDFKEFREHITNSFVGIFHNYWLLSPYEFDEASIIKRLAHTELHKAYVEKLVENLPSVPLGDRLRNSEIHREWIETHWKQSELPVPRGLCTMSLAMNMA